MDTGEYIQLFTHENTYWWFVSKRLFIRTFLSSFPKNERSRILDAGCGTGGNIALLRQYGHVSAVDASPAAVTFCKKNGFPFVIKASVEKLHFPKKSFDLVALFDVLYHKNIKNDVKTLRYLHTFLKPGGYLLMTDCAFQRFYSTHDVSNHARTRYSLPELTQKLRGSGFTVIRSSYIFCFTFPAFILSRLLKKADTIGVSRSEYDVHPLVNAFLIIIERIENRLLRYVNFPFGSSVIILARKNHE